MTIGELASFNEHFGIKRKPGGGDAGGRAIKISMSTGCPGCCRRQISDARDRGGLSRRGAFEGTNVSEARGTTKPFELCGAPWVTPEPFCEALNERNLPGVYFRPHAFEPVFQKHAKTSCGGCQIHVTDRTVFRPVETGVALIEAFRNAD